MTNEADQSVTHWFHAIKTGDEHAANQIWERYFDRIIRLASSRLVPDAAYDEEDLAASVFGALFHAAQEGRYGDLADRDELWALLLVLARRKMINRARHAKAQRRNSTAQAGHQEELQELQGRDPLPDLSVAVEDECRHLINLLGDSLLQDVALRKLEGQTVPEIAAALGMGERTISRKLALIRKHWERRLDSDEKVAM